MSLRNTRGTASIQAALIRAKWEHFYYEVNGKQIELKLAGEPKDRDEFFMFAVNLMGSAQWKGHPIYIGVPRDQVHLARLEIAEDIFREVARAGHPNAKQAAELVRRDKDNLIAEQDYIHAKQRLEAAIAVAGEGADELKSIISSLEASNLAILKEIDVNYRFELSGFITSDAKSAPIPDLKQMIDGIPTARKVTLKLKDLKDIVKASEHFAPFDKGTMERMASEIAPYVEKARQGDPVANQICSQPKNELYMLAHRTVAKIKQYDDKVIPEEDIQKILKKIAIKVDVLDGLSRRLNFIEGQLEKEKSAKSRLVKAEDELISLRSQMVALEIEREKAIKRNQEMLAALQVSVNTEEVVAKLKHKLAAITESKAEQTATGDAAEASAGNTSEVGVFGTHLSVSTKDAVKPPLSSTEELSPPPQLYDENRVRDLGPYSPISARA